MIATSTRTLIVLAVLTGVVACGSADPPGRSGESEPTTPTSASTTPPQDVAKARSVTLVRSGGIRPMRVTLTFAVDQPPPHGFTQAEVDAVLRAAGQPALRHGPSATPTDTCCDRYLYRVTISWPDGTSRTFTTVDGSPQPPALSRLLRLLQSP